MVALATPLSTGSVANPSPSGTSTSPKNASKSSRDIGSGKALSIISTGSLGVTLKLDVLGTRKTLAGSAGTAKSMASSCI